MEKIEHSILNTIVESPYPVDILGLEPNTYEVTMNKPWHSFQIEELAKAFLRLNKLGDIYFYYKNDSIQIRPGLAELKLNLTSGPLKDSKKKGVLYYALTKYGGEKWESYSNPNWAKYIDYFVNHQDDVIEFIANCSDLSRLDEFILKFSHLVIHDLMMMENTNEMQPLVPFEVTYWKTLPQGFRYSCRLQPRNDSVMKNINVYSMKECEEFLVWYTKATQD